MFGYLIFKFLLIYTHIIKKVLNMKSIVIALIAGVTTLGLVSAEIERDL